MEKVKITKIYRNEKDKNGNILKTKDGRPYERVALKTEEYGDKYVSGFGNKANSVWKVGDTVEVEISKNGEYINFEMPKVANGVSPELMAKINQILENTVKILERFPMTGADLPDCPPEDEPISDSVPF